MPEVDIKISKKDFSVELDAKGFQGKSCVKATNDIQRILNGSTVDQKLKPEYQRAVRTQRANR